LEADTACAGDRSGGASLGYASLAGFIAFVQPVVTTLKSLTGSK